MKASKWTSPYVIIKSKGKKIRKRIIIPSKNSGAYLIREIKSKKIVYAGKSHTQLQATIYRHFTKWKRPKNNPGNFGYKSYSDPENYEVRVFICTEKQADRLELIFITGHKPRDNSEKIYTLFENLDASEKKLAYSDYKESKIASKKEELEFDVPF